MTCPDAEGVCELSVSVNVCVRERESESTNAEPSESATVRASWVMDGEVLGSADRWMDGWMSGKMKS